MVLNRQSVVIFFTVFIYLLGFGMIIPVLPLLSTHYGATPFQAGLLMSVFSLMQFVFAPVWGKISDRVGRRPILLICLVGEACSYILLALSRNLEMLFVARILTGFFGASISTASAYVSDITAKENRSKGMALIGAAFGLGFLLGPAIGGGLTLFAETLSSEVHFMTGFSSYGVALLCVLTFIFAYFYLPESLTDANRSAAKKITEKKQHRLKILMEYYHRPTVGLLIGIFGLSTFAMASMEATLVLFMKENFNWGIKEVSFGFAYIGLCIVFTQGYLVRKILPVLGEAKILRVGLFMMFLGFLILIFANSLPSLCASMTLLAFGSGFTNPSILGSVSLLVADDEQGVALGTTQSLSSLGRVLGPALGGLLFGYSIYGSLHTRLPFLLSTLLLLISLILITLNFKKLPVAAQVNRPNIKKV